MKLNCSFVVPVNNKKQLKNLEKSLKEFSDYELIPIEGAKSFFDAWRKGLKKATKKYICFTHQDTEFVAIPKLSKYLKGKVGMVGTAGTTVLHKDQPWWFSKERLHGQILSGQVFHGQGKDRKMSIYGDFGEVVVLDGVCMVTTKKAIEDVGIPDINWAKWDFYDHVISLEYIKKGYKLKTAPFIVVHASTGGGQERFEKDKERFKEEYLDKVWRVK